MVQPQVQTPPGTKYSRRIAKALRVVAGWTNDGDTYLIDGRCSSPLKRQMEPDEHQLQTRHREILEREMDIAKLTAPRDLSPFSEALHACLSRSGFHLPRHA
jgi:hypothetical protein